MRKIIIIIGSVLLLIGAIFIGKKIATSGKKKVPKFVKVINTVYTETVKNKSIPVTINTSGNLVAKNKIDLYAEVQGVLKHTGKDFKTGTKYSKGQSIVSINSDEFYANLQAQKSSYYSAITAIMPDIQLDYPNEYSKWKTYLTNFNLDKTTPTLPKFNSEKEKFFISGRGLLTNYYNVKNLETKLNKYNLKAPFNGTLTETAVTNGSLIRSGQKLGEFIDTSVFELEVNINEAYAYLLKNGNKVNLTNLSETNSWEATVVRVNAKVNQTTQTVKVYLQVKGKELKDGMYLNAALQTQEIKGAFEISRRLLVDDSKVFIVKDSILNLVKINPVYFGNETVVIKGLQNGTSILSKSLPGAYEGMLVKTIKDQE